MKYQFTYRTKAFDLWQLAMYATYSSIVGVINIIFTVAMFLLCVKFWENANGYIRTLLILGVSLFTFIQPVVVYIRAKRQLASVQEDMEIGFDDLGVHVKTESQNSNLKWKTIKGISKKPNMIIVYTTTTHGFILKNKMLGTQKEAFYDYVVSKIQK